MSKSSASTILKIEGMTFASCQRPIEKALRENRSVSDVGADLANRKVTVIVPFPSPARVHAGFAFGTGADVALESADSGAQGNDKR